MCTHADLGRFLFMSDEAIFSHNSSVNEQNCQYWTPTNPRQIHERPLQSSGRCVVCHFSTGNYWALTFPGWWRCLCDSERRTLKPRVRKLFPTWDERPQLEYGNSVVSAGRCHSPYGTTLNEHPTCCIPRESSLSVWWQWPPNSPGLIAADFLWGTWKRKFLLTPSLALTALKTQFVRLRMLRRTLYVATWQVYLGDGSNALIDREDMSKTLYWTREAFCESKTLTYFTV